MCIVLILIIFWVIAPSPVSLDPGSAAPFGGGTTYALHLPKQPVFTVCDLQAVHHILPQLVLVLGGRDEPAKLPASPSPA